MNTEWMNPIRMSNQSKMDQAHYLRHFKAYEIASNYVLRKSVLELGCGAGYGAEYLSNYAKKIVAVDRDINALNFGGKKTTSVQYIHKNIKNIDFGDEKFDVILLFQVFEHFKKKEDLSLLKLIRDNLNDNGILILTTPNRKTRLYPFQKPTNKFHQKEYSARTLSRALKNTFASVKIWGLDAIPEIKKMEHKRVNKSYFKAYIRTPIRTVFLILLKALHINRKKTSIHQKESIVDYKMVKQTEFYVPYSSHDFFLRDSNINKSIDLYAFCKK